MIKKILDSQKPVNAKSNLDEVLDSAERDSYLDQTADVYRQLKGHLEACKAIALDLAPKDYVWDVISAIHHMNMDLMSYGKESEIECELDDAEPETAKGDNNAI
jgi:hypothetical protein